MNRVMAILKLTRVEHSLMLVIAVVAAELLAGGLPNPVVLALSLITPIFVSMGSFAINDYFDIDVDRLNKKEDRPLVNKSLRPRHAIYVAAISLAIGVGASALINAYAFAIAVVFALLAVAYSYRLKETLLLGNMYIAFTMVIPFVFGDYVVSNALAPVIVPISAMVFLSGLAREIHGTIRDYKGDVNIRNAKTLPKAIGTGTAAWAALVLYAIAIAISVYLFTSVAPFRSNLIYGTAITVSDALLLYVGVGHLRFGSGRFYDLARNLSLIAMSLAIVSILLAPLVRI